VADPRALVLADGRLARRRRTGAATAIRELRAQMGAHPPPDLRVEWLMGPPGLPRRNALTSLGNLLLDLGWLHLWLPLTAWRRRARLVAGVMWTPWFSPCPTAVTVHDLTFETLPDAYPAGFRAYARLFTRRAARRARVVIADSERGAQEITGLYGVPAARLRVAPLGVRLPPAGAQEREALVLHVGEFEPRKRVPALVEGHRRYWNESSPESRCRLVLAGAGGADEPAVRAAAAAHPGCELAGFVSAERLHELYAAARLVASASRNEGFGLPLLEAMAHGTPVLAAPGAAAFAIPPGAGHELPGASPAVIAAALTGALADPDDLARRGRAARRAAEGMSWERSARATLDAWRAAL
jgi:glycosyltransferase involved in cell wall biosynthesis